MASRGFTFKGDWLYGGDVTWTEPYYDKSTDPASTDMARLIAQPTPISTTALRPSCGMEEKESIGLQSSPPRWTRHALPRSTTARSRFNPRNESGYSRTFKMWHPIRKNIMYSDDEDGISAGRGFTCLQMASLVLGMCMSMTSHILRCLRRQEMRP